MAQLMRTCRPREDNPYLLLEEMGEGNASDLHTELGLVQSDSHPDIENGRGNDSPISIDRNFSIGDLEDEDDSNSQKPATSGPPSPRRPNKNALSNQHSLNDSEQQSQSSSPRQNSRPVPPPKPSGKKD